MTKNIYEENYSLKYLVNTNRANKKEYNILDVSDFSDNFKKRLISNGYYYAVLVRKN